MPRLSLIVITKNEESTIARCIGSVPSADEIIVVDNGSTDRTATIARGLGAVVIDAPDWPGFGAQKQRALDAATGDWVLSLDADEWIEPPLMRLIDATLATAETDEAYEMPRRSRFCGRIVRHCGWSPDYVTRLFKRPHGRFSDHRVHEHIVIAGRVGRLAAPIEHDSIESWADAEDKIIRYSDAAAAQMRAQGKRSSPLKASLRGCAAFLKTFVARAGFLDGRTGWNVAQYNRRYTDRKWRLLAEPARRLK
ncbi:MAG: glycosyl transferase family 2 [Tardiphaga sp.]|nr:glycosyl transferase family 2 [Tardiphaga sp.]